MGWIISPSEGVTNYDNGSFKLPCSESNVTYSITYVNSEGCSSNTVSYTYVTSGSCDSPTPDCPTQSTIISTNTAVANSGGTQVAVMQILKDSTYTAYTITPTSTSSSYVSNVNQGAELHNNWYVVLADVTANPNTTCRPLYFDVIAEGPTLGTGCTYNNVTATQCPTDYLIGLAGGAIGAIGGESDLARFKNNITDCTTALTVSMSDGSSATIASSGTSYGPDSSYNVIRVNVPQNTSTNSRTVSVTCTLTHAGGARCTDTKTFTQEGASTECTIPNTNIMKMSDTNIPSSSSTSPFTYDLAVVGLCNNYTSFTVDIDSGSYGGWAVNPTVTDRVYDLQCGPTSGRIVTAQIYGNGNTSTRSFTLKVSGSTTDGKTCTKDLSFTQEGATPTPTCGCNSITYSGTYEADPTPDDGKIKLSIDSFSGDWTPAIEFHTSNNTNLMSVNTYNASTVVVKDWANVGTCSKIKFTQIRGSYTKIGVSIERGDSFVTLLSNATIPSSSGTYLNLLTNFNVSDYSNSSNCTLKITFR